MLGSPLHSCPTVLCKWCNLFFISILLHCIPVCLITAILPNIFPLSWFLSLVFSFFTFHTFCFIIFPTNDHFGFLIFYLHIPVISTYASIPHILPYSFLTLFRLWHFTTLFLFCLVLSLLYQPASGMPLRRAKSFGALLLEPLQYPPHGILPLFLFRGPHQCFSFLLMIIQSLYKSVYIRGLVHSFFLTSFQFVYDLFIYFILHPCSCHFYFMFKIYS